jgi:5'-3' exonuclease
MLLRLVKQHRPEYIAVLLDAGRETFPNQMLATYKGHRTGAPDLEKVRVLFNELGFFNLLKLLEFNQPA